MKNTIKKNYLYIIIAILAVISIAFGIYAYKERKKYIIETNNEYNMAFYELVDYVENVETYLAKSLISTTAEHGAETLTNVWREANLAQTYLSRLPIQSQELENTSKFLNQVSDYSYSLSRKNIEDEKLTNEDLENLKQLHNYSVELENTLNQLSEDLNSGRVSWSDLSNQKTISFAQQVSTVLQDSFTSLEENFHQYSGLIYDGAFSEHLTSVEKKGLTGEDIDEQAAQQKVKEFLGEDKIKEISSSGLSENTDIASYIFTVKTTEEDDVNISISKKGGHLVYMNSNREVEAEVISDEEAIQKGKKFLQQKGFETMKESYYLKGQGVLTINYAYTQDNVIMYPDLIKVKVALDNGEILGVESTGYLNSHYIRDLSKTKIPIEEAKKNLNKDLEIASEGLAIIPTEWETEVLCYEFKGKVDDTEFLVYINAETGEEEDILVIKDTPNGTLTM